MSTTKKVLTAIFSVIIIGVFAFLITWGVINWTKVKEGMAGNGLYTQDDVQNAYEDGYSSALTDKEEYDKLINSYRDTITTQNDLISQYTSEATALNNSIKDYQGQINTLSEQKIALETQIETLNTIKASNEATISELNGEIATLSNQIMDLQVNKNENERQINVLTEQLTNLQNLNTQLQENNALNVKTIDGLNAQIISLNNQIADLTLQSQNNSSTVNALNAKIAELQKSVSYYEQYIATLESGEQVVATFEFNGSVYNIQIVSKNSILSVTTPTSTAYVIFNGWTVDGEPIDLATYRITQNTRIVADVTLKYEVNFIVDGENRDSQIVLKDSKVTPPANPTKNGHVFDGWTIDGNNVVNLNDYTVTQNVTFTAKFTKQHSVVFKYEDNTLKTDTVKSGNYATAPTVTSTAYKVFNGWTVNGVVVNVSEYRITADTVFIANITYKYDVKFMADGKAHSTQIVEKNSKPTVPATPTKANYVFVGWSIDGKNIVDVSKHTVTDNVTFTAIFRIDKFTVTFKNGNSTVATQEVQNGSYATVPAFDSELFMGWTVDGNTIVNIATYKITETTTFTAKFGSWKLLGGEQYYVYGNGSTNSANIFVSGLKAGDKIKVTANYIKLNIDDDGSNSYWYNVADGNGCYGFEYGYDGNWVQLDAYGGSGYGEYKELTSLTPFTSTVGFVDYEKANQFTITLTCKSDGVLTVEWSDEAGFYIEVMTMWDLYVVR